jgi:hypothetical protein
MPQVCTVCSHPDALEINEALVIHRRSKRTIANQYGLHDSSIQRHKEHIPELLLKAARAEEIVEADKVLDRILEHLDRGHALESKAGALGQLGHEISAHNSVRSDIELLAEALGKIDRAGGIKFVLNNPVWVMLEQTIVDALEGYPDAKAAVLTALQDAERRALTGG